MMLASVPAPLDSALQHYVNAGGSMLVVLGPASAVLPRVPVLDEAIQASSYAGREGERFLTVTDLDAGHPALRSVDRFNGVKFYQAIHVTSGKSRVLAKLNDGTPLVLERTLGEGKVLAFTSPFDNVLNDLPIHAAWVPFIAQSALYLGGAEPEQPVNLPVDSYVELRAGDGEGRGCGSSRSRRQAGACRSKKRSRRATSRSIAKAFSKSRRRADAAAVAAHADRRESDLAPIEPETLDLWKRTGTTDAPDPSNGGRARARTEPIRNRGACGPTYYCYCC